MHTCGILVLVYLGSKYVNFLDLDDFVDAALPVGRINGEEKRVKSVCVIDHRDDYAF
jgi:hypothetical protein